MNLKVKNIFLPDAKNKLKLPLYTSRIKAGFPSPADDYIEKNLDLNEYLVKHPSSTFFVKVEGDSMFETGIRSGDILIVDRSLEVKNNKVVIAAINGELTVKRIQKKKDKIFLIPDNEKYSPIEVSEDATFEIWGVVTFVIHQVD